MNILILSCGSHVGLVNCFKGCFENVVVTDCDKNAPSLYVADKYYVVPPMTDYSYLPCIFDICQNNDINAVLPLHESELSIISQARAEFRKIGVLAIVSDEEIISLCKDKLRLYDFLHSHKIPAVPTFRAKEILTNQSLHFSEMYVKPRFGAGSVNTFKFKHISFLREFLTEVDDELLVQPAASGREFGIDLYIDFISGAPIACFCKQKLRMRAGETDKSVSVHNKRLADLAISAALSINARGPIDVDIVEREGAFEILEINPRFGGGYMHAYECGMDFPALIAKNANLRIANEPMLSGYASGVYAMKYSQVMTRNS